MLVNGGPMTKLANAAFYPSVLLSLFWVFAPPFTGAFGIWEMIRQRRSPAAIFGLVTLVLNLAIVLPYYLRAANSLPARHQSSSSTARSASGAC